MPRKANTTSDAVADLSRQSNDWRADIANLANEIRDGRCDDLADPIEYARRFSALARTAADAATVILTTVALKASTE